MPWLPCARCRAYRPKIHWCSEGTNPDESNRGSRCEAGFCATCFVALHILSDEPVFKCVLHLRPVKEAAQ